MGLFSWVKSLFSGSRKGTGLEVSRFLMAPPRRGTSQLIAAYKEVPFLRTVVDTVADEVACAEWRVLKPTTRGAQLGLKGLSGARLTERRKELLDAGAAVEVPDHPILKLIDDPSDFLTGHEIMKLQQVYLDLVGEAFFAVEKVGPVPVGLWPIPPHWVRTLPDYSQPRAQWQYQITLGRFTKTLPADQVIHMRHPDPDDPMGRGVGVAFALGDELDTDEYAARFTKNFFFNNSVPAAVISIEGVSEASMVANPAVKAFKESIVREHKGADNAGKTLFTGGKVTIARLDTSFKDMNLVELRKFLMAFVRMNYRVPPEIVGDISSSNKATAYAARENLAQQAIVPRLGFLCAHFQKFVMPLFGDDAILIYESPVPADQELALRVMVAQPSAFSFDEWRAVAGKKPDPNLKGYPALMPGQKPGDSQQPPTPEQGGAAEATQQENKPSAGKSDPPWASRPLT